MVTLFSYGQTTREVYINYETGIAIDLEYDKFKITTSESWPNSCIVVEHELSKGTIETSGDTLTLVTTGKQRIVLIRETDEILRSVSFNMIPRGKKLYAGTKFFPNGRIKEQGSWDNGKKTGLWMYWNETGEVINKRIYKQGTIKKENYRFRWEK